MAIQKINLGTEPLGEGGDTYRSANTKINENFSNTTHAASRLVGLNPTNLVQARDVKEASLKWRHNGNIPDVDYFDNAQGGDIHYAMGGVPLPSSSQLPENITDGYLSTSVVTTEELVPTTGRLRQTILRTTNLYDGIHEIFRLKNGTTGSWSDWIYTLTTANTKKDSNTKLLMRLGDTIPRTSAASRTVGSGSGMVPEASQVHNAYHRGENRGVDVTAVEGEPTFSTLPAGKSFVTGPQLASDGPPGLGSYAHVITEYSYTTTIGRQWAFSHTAGENIYIRFFRGNTFHPWQEFYTSGNTTKDTATGFLKASSPVLHVYNDSITKIHEAEQLDITVDKKGVGHYEIHGTTGLRKNDGWFMSPPRDVHGNVLCMVDLEEEDGVIILRTYKKLFDFETVSIVHDYDNPMDIPEGVCVEFRFNDLPQEKLYEPEPEEYPIVDEVVEPEVVEEPTEEPAEEPK